MSRQTTVLCPLDLTVEPEAQVELATSLSRALGARIVLEHNIEPTPPGYLAVGWMWGGEHGVERASHGREAAAQLRTIVESLPEDVNAEARLTRGPVVDALLRTAAEVEASLVVLKTRGLRSCEHDSVTRSLVGRSHCPLLVVGERCRSGGVDWPLRPQEPPPSGRPAALLALQGTPDDALLERFAGRLAAELSLSLVTVPSDSPASGHWFRRRAPDLAVERLVAEAERLEASVIVAEIPPVRPWGRGGAEPSLVELLAEVSCPLLLVPYRWLRRWSESDLPVSDHSNSRRSA